MAKQSRRERKRKGHIGVDIQQLSSSELLQKFKSLYANENWIQALSTYRAWTAKMNRKRDTSLEAELLFRSASICYEEGKYRPGIEYLDQAARLDPERSEQYLFYKGICFAKNGNVGDALPLFEALCDEYHTTILAFFYETRTPIPREMPKDIPFEKDMLLNFWKGIVAGEEITSASKVLQNIARANSLFLNGRDPEPQLAILTRKPGLESVAAFLTLMFAIYKRRNIRVRHIISDNYHMLRTDDAQALIDTHLILLLREKSSTRL